MSPGWRWPSITNFPASTVTLPPANSIFAARPCTATTICSTCMTGPPAGTAHPAHPHADAAGAQPKSGLLGNVAKAALKHLSPVGKAEAAPLAHEASSGGSDWAIQLGAFHDEAAAEEATRNVAGLAIAKAKPHQILAPAKRDSSRLYRARLLHFTAKGAQAACIELHRKGIACSVVRPGSLKVASG